MGGNNSTEVQVVEPVPKPFQIPTIPFWDGQPVLIMWVPVDIEYKPGCCTRSITTSINQLLDAIVAENTAGNGFKLASVFFPLWHEPYGPEPIKLAYSDKWCSMLSYARAMCIFQKDSSSSTEKFISMTSTVESKLLYSSAYQFKSEGHEEINEKLVEAGLYYIFSVSFTVKFGN